MPSITPKQLFAKSSKVFTDLPRDTQKLVKKAVDTLEKACLDDLNVVPRFNLKHQAADEFDELKADKKHPEAYIFSIDGHDVIAVTHSKKNEDRDLVAKLYDRNGRPLIDKGINFGPVEVESGPESFFMEGGSDVDLFLPGR